MRETAGAQARRRAGGVISCLLLAAALAIPIALTAASPLIAWRGPIYIAAGFAGVLALGLLLTQPALMLDRVSLGLSPTQRRRAHRWGGAGLAMLVGAHVTGLWITSPPDMIDALLFRAPTLFSIWGVVAFWAVVAMAALAAARRRLPPRIWRAAHLGLATLLVAATALHAVPITGAMEQTSKMALCAMVSVATGMVLFDRYRARRRRAQPSPSGGASGEGVEG